MAAASWHSKECGARMRASLGASAVVGGAEDGVVVVVVDDSKRAIKSSRELSKRDEAVAEAEEGAERSAQIVEPEMSLWVHSSAP